MTNIARPVERAFLNCNINPRFFYSNLKALTLLFDQIVVWQPSEAQVEQLGICDGPDLLAGFEQAGNDEPALIAGGRPNYFDPLAKDTRGTPSFREALGSNAEFFKAKIPRDHQAFYEKADELSVSSLAPHMGVIHESLTADLRVRSSEIANKLSAMGEHRPNKEVATFFAEFLMDTGICTQLSRPGINAFPLVDDKQSYAYRILNKAALDEGKVSVLESLIERSPVIEQNEHRGRHPDLIRSITKLYEANSLPWSDIRKLKKEIKAPLRKHFKLRAAYDARDIVDLADSVERTKRLIRCTSYFVGEGTNQLVNMLHQAIAPGVMTLPEIASEIQRQMGLDKRSFIALRDSMPMALEHNLTPAIQSNPAAANDPEVYDAVRWAGSLSEFVVSLWRVPDDLKSLLQKRVWTITNVSTLALASLEYSAVAQGLKQLSLEQSETSQAAGDKSAPPA